MTQELEKLYDDYYKMFDRTPDGYMELEYGEGSYKAYVRDIKKSLFSMNYKYNILTLNIFNCLRIPNSLFKRKCIH